MDRQRAGAFASYAIAICASAVASAASFSADESTRIVGEFAVVTAHAEDTLIDLASRFDVGFDELVAANPTIDPWLPPEGARVVLPTRHILPNVPHVGIVVNIAAMRLFYFSPHAAGEKFEVISFPIAIGRDDWPTPVGITTVVAKVRDPVWDVPAAIRAEHALDGDPLPSVVLPGPANPLGRYALRLGLDGYLIHGTNRPFGIGMRLTHGCMRLYRPDIEALFARVAVGTPVRIIDARYLAAWIGGVLYVEAHPAQDAQADAVADLAAVDDAVIHAPGASRPLTAADWTTIHDIAAHPRGLPLPVNQTYDVDSR